MRWKRKNIRARTAHRGTARQRPRQAPAEAGSERARGQPEGPEPEAEVDQRAGPAQERQHRSPANFALGAILAAVVALVAAVTDKAEEVDHRDPDPEYGREPEQPRQHAAPSTRHGTVPSAP